MAYLDNLINNVWSDFQRVKRDSCVVKNSIPIIWFGDLNAYFQEGNKRIVTIGLNPSKREFHDNKQSVFSTVLRFPQAGCITNNISLTNKDVADYKYALNKYFDVNPYRTWFKYFENVLNMLDSSYCDKEKYRAIHIDACSPMATDPTWGGLCFNEKKQLMTYWNNYFNSFLNFLDPKIILISTNRDIVNKIFGNNWVDYINLRRIYLRVKKDGNRVILWGYNNRGVPFCMGKGIGVNTIIRNIRQIYNIP